MTDVSPNQAMAVGKSNQEAARTQLADWLRQARERSGISIEAVSQETRISKTYILSLESGDLESLPGKVFGRGFIKNITRLLRSDTNEGLRLYDACWENVVISPSTDENPDAKTVSQTDHQKSKKEVLETRMMESDMNSTQFVQKLPARRTSAGQRFSIKLPAWVVHTLVSPQIRLWILTGLATLFVGLVFGRWAAGTLHKNRLAAKTEVAATSAASSMSAPDEAVSGAANSLDADREFAKQTGVTSAVSEADREAAAAGLTATQNQVVTEPATAKSTMPADTGALVSAEDNPLYMPTASSAAFEQVLEVKVSGDVDIKLTIDGKKVDRTKYVPESYRFTFNDRAELHLGDASLVDVIYNGKSLGNLGNKGRRRRIVLQAKASLDDFPQ